MASQEPGAPGEYTDVESLLKTSAEKMYEQLKPKLEAGGKVRDILEDRATGFQERAKQFVLAELNNTATGLLKAIEAEEATLLLDFNQAVDASFPPVPVLLAGLLSPSILALSQVSHLLQLCFLFLPIAVASGWALYEDIGAPCSAIPTMIAWIHTAFFLSFFLTLGHIMIAVQINSGKAAMKAKSEEISARLAHNAADGETDLSDMQEIFIGSSVLVQQALLIEDGIRRSFWHNIIGLGTLLWLLTTFWNWVIVIGWTFVPGTIAFHEKAHFATDYCGAWASVFVARVVCILVPLFFFVNLLQVVDWITKLMINSKGFADSMLKIAEQADAGMSGLPVVQYIVKAFVLRGSTDTLAAKLTVALSEKVRLQREHAEIAQQLQDLEAKIKYSKKETKGLKKKADTLGGTGLDAMINQLKHVEALDADAWKEEGVKLVSQATADAAAAQQAATEELDKVAEWIMQIVEQIQKSDMLNDAIAQAKNAAEMAQKAAEEGAKKAQELAEEGAKKAQELADQLPDQEQMAAYAEQAQQAAGAAAAQAQVAAQAGMVQAQAGLAQAQEAATPLLAEAREKGQQALDQAQVAGKQALDQAQVAGKQALSEAQKAAEQAKGEASKYTKK